MAYDKTIFNRTPYYDDFDEDKKFLRMLFRPGYAVQARELTQAQTILQNQIQRFGDHLFEDGSRVLGGDVASQNAYYLRVQRKDTDGGANQPQELIPSNYENYEITQNNAGVITTARVLEVISPSGEFDDYYVFIIQFISGSEFRHGATFQTSHPSVERLGRVAEASQNILDSTYRDGIQGLAKVASVNAGIFYSNGYFVKNDFQTLSPYTKDDLLRRNFTYPTTEVGFTIQKDIVTPTDDPTLRDPANGTYNYNAPGANRYKVTLKLTFAGGDGHDDGNFITLITYTEGKVTKKNVYTEYAAIEDTLARRTFDESGSYTVRPFELDLREHLLENNNRGLYSDLQGGKRSKAVAAMNPGKAYIFGYEFETQSPEYVSIDKTRDSSHQVKTLDTERIPHSLGPYAVGTILGSTNQTEGNIDSANQIRGFINLLEQSANGLEGKAKVRFYYREFDETNPYFGKFVFAGTANVNHMVRDDRLWVDRESGGDGGDPGTYPQGRRWSAYYRFYLSDIDKTPLQEGAGIPETGDLDKCVFYGNEPSFGPFESYMVLADDADLQVYEQDQFDPQNASETPVWKRWIAGGKVLGDETESGSFKVWEPAEGNKLIHNDTENPSLLYELPEGSLARRVDDLEYTTQIVIPIPKEDIRELSSAQNQVTVSLTDLGISDRFRFAGPIGSDGNGDAVLSNQDKGDYYVLAVAGEGSGNNWNADDGSEPPSHACPMNLYGFTFVIGDGGTQLTISGPNSSDDDEDFQGIEGNFNYNLIATVVFNNAISLPEIRRKKLLSESILLGGNTAGEPYAYGTDIPSGGFPVQDPRNGSWYYELPHSDVLRITSIQTDGGGNRQNDFVFDNGQRDTEYDYARLYIKNQVSQNYRAVSQGGGRLDGAPEILRIEYDYFEHDGEGPIVINSYFTSGYLDGIITPTAQDAEGQAPYFDDELDTTGIRFSEVPVYTSPVTGQTFQLANCVDFRFRRPPKGIPASGNILAANGGPAQQSHSPRNMLAADELRTRHTYFLPRIDKVVLTKRLSDEDTTFDILKGIPSLDPVAPDDREDSMTLYQLTIPPFVFNVDDIRTKFIENKRYTMRDIGRIEDRVGGLEYFTTLSDLEQKAASSTLTVDSEGGAENDQIIAIKNAILVDSFRGHGVGDVASNDYRCSVDFENGTLRPSFVSKSFSLEGVSGGNAGITIDANHIARIDHSGLAGSTVEFIQQTTANTVMKVNPFYLTNWMGFLDMSPYGDYWWDVNYRPVIRVNTIGEADAWKSVTYQNPTEAGKGFGNQWNDWQSMWHGLEYSTEDDTNSAVLDTITRPRTSRTSQLLPKKYEDQESSISRSTETIAQKKTRVGVQIRSIPDRIKKIIGGRIVDVSIVPFVRSRELTINAHGLKPNTEVYCFFDGVNVTDSCTIDGATAGANGSFTTGTGVDAGRIKNLKFTIPAGQYEAGEKLFRIIDESNNDVEFATTSADGTYYAQGLKLSRDSGTVSVRPRVLRRQTVSSERVVSNTFSRETVFDNNSNTQYIDPLAQSFTVGNNDHPGGVFLDSVDVWFKDKHTDLPITLQIRPTVQGAPHSSIIIPFSEVVKYPADIAVNDLSTGPLTATRFEFKTPVFLEPGDYTLCFVTNTGDYEMYVGEINELDILTQRLITSKFYVNNLYEPQNGSSAVPNTSRDLMFRINKCTYSTAPLTLSLQVPTLGSTADMDMVYVQSKQLNMQGADLSYELNIRGEDQDSFNRLVEANNNVVLDKRRSVRSSGDINLDITFDPATSDIAPMVDISQSSIVAIGNYVDSDAGGGVEIQPEANGEVGCKARYITRRVSLEGSGSNSDPNAFQVILDKAGSGTVDVYLKAQSGQDTTPFDERDYIPLERIDYDPDSADEDPALNNDSTTFTELRYKLTNEKYTEHFGDSNGYNTFSVKICLHTGDSTNPPIVKDLRAIALTIPEG